MGTAVDADSSVYVRWLPRCNNSARPSSHPQRARDNGRALLIILKTDHDGILDIDTAV